MAVPASIERNRRLVVGLLREIIAKDPYPEQPTIPALLQLALEDSGYWDRGGTFSFRSEPETGRVRLRLQARSTEVADPEESHIRRRFRSSELFNVSTAILGAVVFEPGLWPVKPRARRTTADLVLNDHNRARLALLLADTLKSEPRHDWRVVPWMIHEALQDVRYWDQGGREFGFRCDNETGQHLARVSVQADDEWPTTKVAIGSLPPGTRLDEIDVRGLFGTGHGSPEGWTL